MMNEQRQPGFTLIEISIVLLIVTIILGYTVGMYPIQQELKQYREANKEMDTIIASLHAFAQVNGYLPCPANNNVASSGFECRDADTILNGNCGGNDPAADFCDILFGFVPGKTLGIEGDYNDIGLLIDPWGAPYRYQITDSDDEDNDNDGTASAGDGDGIGDFYMQGGIRSTARSTDPDNLMNLGLLRPDLSVCNTDPSPVTAGTEGACGVGGTAVQVVVGVPAVILSTGKNTDGDVATTSWIQRENLDNDPADRIFISIPFVSAVAGEYDDLVKWVSPNILYSKMIEAGQLP